MSKQYTVLDAAAPRAITSSTDASPIVVTSAAAHGYSTGDHVSIMGHTTNIAANGMWEITVTSTTKYELTKNLVSGLISSGTGGGAGAGGVEVAAPKVILCDDFDAVNISVYTDGGGDFAGTLKCAVSDAEDSPDFAAAVSASNQYTYAQMNNLEDDSGDLVGDTGIVIAAADLYRSYEVNVSGKRWITLIPTAGTAGEVTVEMRGYVK